MPKSDGFFEDDTFVVHETYFYKDSEDMAEFGELMDKFAKRMHEPEESYLAVNAHNGCVQVTGRIGRQGLFQSTSAHRNSP